MRCFTNIAKLIKETRLNHKNQYSQSELSHLLGYKNGQFISNVERALCNIPLKMLSKVAQVLDITSNDLRDAILKDQTETLDNYLAIDVTTVKSKVIASNDQQSTVWIGSKLSSSSTTV